MSPKGRRLQCHVGDSDTVNKRTIVVTFNVSSMSQLIHVVFYYIAYVLLMQNTDVNYTYSVNVMTLSSKG